MDGRVFRVDAQRQALMKPSAVLVDVVCGPVDDEAALIATPRAGRPWAAGPDVIPSRRPRTASCSPPSTSPPARTRSPGPTRSAAGDDGIVRAVSTSRAAARPRFVIERDAPDRAVLKYRLGEPAARGGTAFGASS